MPLRVRNLSRATELGDRLDVADSLWAKFMGLMGRPALDPGSGLWLTDSNGIHMMFMRFPIDAVFLGRPDPARDDARVVVSVHPGLRTWIGLVPLVRGANGVLELPVGTIERSGTAVGDLIALEPAAEAPATVRGKVRVKHGRSPSGAWRRSDGSRPASSTSPCRPRARAAVVKGRRCAPTACRPSIRVSVCRPGRPSACRRTSRHRSSSSSGALRTPARSGERCTS